jgi:hypothetical protein
VFLASVRGARCGGGFGALRANVVDMTTASYQQIVELLGDVDPLFVKRIEDTGASVEEIGEALSDVESERFGGERRMVSSPRVGEVRAILDDMLDDPEEEDGGMVDSSL